MRKFFVILITLLLFTGCSNSKIVEVNKKIEDVKIETVTEQNSREIYVSFFMDGKIEKVREFTHRQSVLYCKPEVEYTIIKKDIEQPMVKIKTEYKGRGIKKEIYTFIVPIQYKLR
ncbi:hypothetical protein [Clostridium botulinum]|uniref:hypothetical protein n=1 Tax=Clostridium botulinum TaxID=1491 RepID=UPI0013CD133C|nr:hypothetical protein [Clostridium botulinum]